MKKTAVLILCYALILVSGNDTSNVKENDKTSSSVITSTTPISTVSAKDTTETSTFTSSSTTSEITTASHTTITISTTEEPNVTTTTTSTTNAPNPTTNAPSPTTPVPDPTVGKWVINGTDNTFIIAQMAVQLIVVYNSTNQQNLLKATIDVPADNRTTAVGTFTPYTESMKLSWKSAGSGENFITFIFNQNKKTYSLNSVEVSIGPADLPNIALNSTLKLVHKQEHFNTTIGNSYRCVRLQTFNLTTENDKVVVGHMKVSDLQFQAFNKKNHFGLAEDCAFDTPDIVPIAVGCILAGLVVIVLGAYLVTRRRSQARGYLSM